MNKILTFLIFILFSAHDIPGQVMPITSSNEEAINKFKEGRDIFHLAWFEEAPVHLNEAVRLDSTLAVAYIYLAMTEYFQFHDPAISVEKARKFGKNASDGERLLIEGWSKFIFTEYLETVNYIDSLLVKYPEDDYAKHILGFSYRDAGNPQRAVEVLTELTERENPFGPAYNHLGYSYADLKDMDKAITTMDKFIEWAPYNPSAYDSKAHLYYDMGEYDKAISYFVRATLIENRFAYSQRFLGHSLMMLEELIAARKAYEKAGDMSFNYHESFRISLLSFIGYTYIAEGSDKNAEVYFTKVIKHADSLGYQSTKLSAIESLTKYFLHKKNIDKAEHYLNQYKSEIKSSPDRINNYEFYLAWFKCLKNPNMISKSTLEDLEIKENQIIIINAILHEYKSEYVSAIKEYEKFEIPDIYIMSRIFNLSVKTEDAELYSKIKNQLLDWRGYPSLNHALSILNTN